MFNWFKRKSKISPDVVSNESKYKNCDIEHLPISGFYYPRCNGKYIWLRYYGAYTLESNIDFGNHFNSEKEAKNFLNKYLEARGWGTKIIKLDGN